VVGESGGAGGKGFELEDAQRTVPDDGSAWAEETAEFLGGPRADVEDIRILGNVIRGVYAHAR
jgi:hypothetical protein